VATAVPLGHLQSVTHAGGSGLGPCRSERRSSPVEQEVVGVDDLDVERPEHPRWIVADVCRDDGIFPADESGGNDVAVVNVGERHGVLQGLPSRDAGVLERVVRRRRAARSAPA